MVIDRYRSSQKKYLENVRQIMNNYCIMVLRLFCVLHGLDTTLLIVIDRFLAKPALFEAA